MTPFDAAVLGTIQGLTEFIPVSSSGHLILAEHFLGLPNNFTFDVLLNFGTLLALIIFFRKRILIVLKDIFINRRYRFVGYLLIATLPAAVVGFLMNDIIDELGKYLSVVIISLVVVGALMVVYGKQKPKLRVQDDHQATLKDALLIGAAQVAALIPGVSRSGSTILAALNLGFSAKAAADFSFMLAIPIIFGATMRVFFSSEGREFISNNLDLFLIGNIFSFVFGALAVKILLDFLKKRGLVPFGWYRLGLATVLTVLLLTNVI